MAWESDAAKMTLVRNVQYCLSQKACHALFQSLPSGLPELPSKIYSVSVAGHQRVYILFSKWLFGQRWPRAFIQAGENGLGE
jgi:hypothetical protein